MGNKGACMFEIGKVAKQLPLAMHLNDDATFTEFCWRGNELLQKQLIDTLSKNSDKFLYLWGSNGSGKSHILQACCQYASNQGNSSIYIPLKMLEDSDNKILEGIEERGLICLDDIDCKALNKVWEEEIFHLYNRIKDNEHTVLIISSQKSPNNSSIQLPDLRSRLSSGLIIHINELIDDDKIHVIQTLALNRGFILSKLVCQYLIQHYARNMHDLYELLNRLDEASLVAQRKITIPFVKEVLNY
jgi:DnaA family protein